jgi:hypothetical protein
MVHEFSSIREEAGGAMMPLSGGYVEQQYSTSDSKVVSWFLLVRRG